MVFKSDSQFLCRQCNALDNKGPSLNLIQRNFEQSNVT